MSHILSFPMISIPSIFRGSRWKKHDIRIAKLNHLFNSYTLVRFTLWTSKATTVLTPDSCSCYDEAWLLFEAFLRASHQSRG